MQGAGKDIYGFRAPRLETNSCQSFALKQLGYQYDDGLEEGYEDYINETNPIWPYTTDNGTPNSFIQKNIDEKIYLDSMPAALWELPLDAVVVPVALRPQVYTKYHQISTGAKDEWALNADSARADSISWVSNGKVTALDFNMFILWGMDSSEFVQTMKANLTARMQHGKAPVQLAAHTDYYTPIYDNATLMLPLNKDAYGLVVTKGWNTYKNRQGAVSAFLDYAIAQGCYVVSGHELIEALKILQATDAPGTAETLSGTWTFGNNAGTSTTTLATTTGDHFGPATVTFGAAGADCGYLLPVTAGALTGLHHISLSYKTSQPLELRLICGTITYKVLLNNIGPQVASGIIPMSAFVRDDTVGYTAPITVAQINGIEIAPLAVGTAHPAATFTVSNLKTYGVKLPLAVTAPMITSNDVKLTVNRISSARAEFTAPVAGFYTVRMYGLNGKLFQTCNVNVAKAGVASAVFNGRLSPSIYIVKISGNGIQRVGRTIVTAGL
jgi:hypothetical protein